MSSHSGRSSSSNAASAFWPDDQHVADGAAAAASSPEQAASSQVQEIVMVKALTVHVTPLERTITVHHDLQLGWDIRQLYDQALDAIGLKYGDAWLEVDGQRLHPDQLVQETWTELIMVLNPALSVWEIPPPPPPASSQGVPASSQGAPPGSQATPRRRRSRDQSLLAQRHSLWPSTAEWPVLLHMERNNATMAGTAPNWTHWQERFPRVRHFVSISFRRDVVVLAGFHGMFTEHAALMMEACTRGHSSSDGLQRMRSWTAAAP